MKYKKLLNAMVALIVSGSYDLAPENDYDLMRNDDDIVIQYANKDTNLLPSTADVCQMVIPQIKQKRVRSVRNLGVSLFPNGLFGMCR